VNGVPELVGPVKLRTPAVLTREAPADTPTGTVTEYVRLKPDDEPLPAGTSMLSAASHWIQLLAPMQAPPLLIADTSAQVIPAGNTSRTDTSRASTVPLSLVTRTR